MKCSDDMMDVIRLWIKNHQVDFKQSKTNVDLKEIQALVFPYINDEDKDMRFKVKSENGVFRVDDRFDIYSPVNEHYTLSRSNAQNMVDWLNENVKELTFNDKVRKVIDELWDDDEVIVDENIGYVSVTEIKETAVTSSDIRAKINCHVKTTTISAGKNLYKIIEV